jgi:hypothetical protein
MEIATNRRKFLAATIGLTAASLPGRLFAQSPAKTDPDIDMIRPLEGYSPQIGTLVSMMTSMRQQVLNSTRGMTQADLDFLLDSKANTIGAMLLHLAATNVYYHLHTFEGKKWGSWDESVKKQWDIPMNLGEPARKTIKGHNLDYYLDILGDTRAKTFAEFRKRDDKWLQTIDADWGRVNYHWEWFHVCEHESNHNGQIKLIKARLPGAKPESAQ